MRKNFCKMRRVTLFFTWILFVAVSANAQKMDQTIYQFNMTSIDGENVDLSQYKGKVLIVVNTASECGLTPQYEHLQAFWDSYKDKGVVILGFPANNFGGQEPGSDTEIKGFCQRNYGVTFPMFSKISVTGSDQHPLYQFLTQKKLNGVQDSEVQWNFQKYLIGKDGKLAAVISPGNSVQDDAVKKQIEGLLN